jgi:WD40 repeat protein
MNTPPDQNHDHYDQEHDRTPPARAAVTHQQASRNVCLVIAAALLGMVLLSLCIVSLFLIFMLQPGQQIAVPTPEVAAPNPGQRVDLPTATPPTSAPSGKDISPATVEHLTEVKHLVEGAMGPALYSPDGSLIAVAMGHDILLYDIATMEMVQSLSAHTHDISSLAFSPLLEGGKPALLVSSALDEPYVLVWDVQAGQPRWRFEGHDGWIRSVAFSPDGTQLATGSIDTTINIWDMDSGEVAQTLRGHTTIVSGVTFAPGGMRLASTSRDGTLRLWDLQSGQELEGGPRPFFEAPTDPTSDAPYWTTGVDFSPDGRSVAVGAADGVVRILSLSSGEVEQTLSDHRALVVIRGVAFSPDGETLATASLDGTVRLWDARTGARLATLDHKEMQLFGVSWHPDSVRLISNTQTSGEVLLWDTSSGEVVQSLPLAQGVLTSLVYSSSGALLGSSGTNGTIRVYSIAKDRHFTLAGGAIALQPISFLSNLELVVVTEASSAGGGESSEDGSVVVFHMDARQNVQEISRMDGVPRSVLVNPDGTLLAIGGRSGEIVLWDVQQREQAATLRGIAAGDGISLLAFSSDGALLAASNELSSEPGVVGDDDDSAPASSSPEIGVWDVERGELLHTLRGHTDMVMGIAAQPGGSLLASVSIDGSVRLWDMAQGEEVLQVPFDTSDGLPISVAFSPGGDLLAVGTTDGLIHFWDMEMEARAALEDGGGMPLVHTLDVGDGNITSLAFRSDGKQLALSNGGVHLFELR